jgi:SAM-dependent methyltransferase
MRFEWDEVARYLSCPDDGAVVQYQGDTLQCGACARLLPLRDNFVEMLPSGPVEIPEPEMPAEYRQGYLQAWSQRWEKDEAALPFGAPEGLSPKMRGVRERQTAEVLRSVLLETGPANCREMFCDLSAGAGHTTFAAAREFRLVFHCDLSVAAVRYASAAAKRTGVNNLVVVRADYFRPPFRDSVQRMTCLDSLIRGPWHELRLLASIRQALAPSGAAVVDFHNWWHNPLRRMGLLPQNFGENRSYTRREVLSLLAQAGIKGFELGAFFQEGDWGRWPILRSLVPATRFVVRYTR